MSVPHLQPVHASRCLFCLVYCNLRRLATSRLRDRLRVKASDVSRLRERRMRSEGKRATRSGPTSKLTGSKTWESLGPAKSNADILVLGPNRPTNYRKCVLSSFRPVWKIKHDFFKRPIMARTQILVHRWGPRLRILALFRRLCT